MACLTANTFNLGQEIWSDILEIGINDKKFCCSKLIEANFIVFFLFAGQLELKLTTKSRLGTDIKLEYLRNTSILNHWNETIWSKIIIRCNTYKSFTRSILLKYFKRFIFDIYIFKYSNKKCLFLNEESHNTNVLFNGIRCTFIRLIYSSISRE